MFKFKSLKERYSKVDFLTLKGLFFAPPRSVSKPSKVWTQTLEGLELNLPRLTKHLFRGVFCTKRRYFLVCGIFLKRMFGF